MKRAQKNMTKANQIHLMISFSEIKLLHNRKGGRGKGGEGGASHEGQSIHDAIIPKMKGHAFRILIYTHI